MTVTQVEVAGSVSRVFKLGTMTGFLLLAYYALLSMMVYILPLGIGIKAEYLSNWDVYHLVSGAVVIFLSGFLVALLQDEGQIFWITVLFILMLCPSLVLFSAGNIKIEFAIIAVFAVFLVWLSIYFLGSFRVPMFGGLPHALALQIIVGAVIAYGAFVVFLVGINTLNLNLSELYETRSSAAGALPVGFGYLSGSVTGALLPVGLVLAIQRRSWIILFILLLGAMVPAAMLGHKSMAVLPISTVVICFMLSSRYWKHILFGMIGFLLLACFIDLVVYWQGLHPFNAPWIASIFLRRALLVPSILNFEYMQFFEGGPYYLWADSKLTLGLISSPYDYVYSALIGKEFYGSSETFANTGFIGSGFAQAGLVGVIIYSVLLGILMSIAVTAARRQAFPFTAAFIPVVVTGILSSDALTTILSHGAWLAIVLSLAISPLSGRTGK